MKSLKRLAGHVARRSACDLIASQFSGCKGLITCETKRVADGVQRIRVRYANIAAALRKIV